MEQALTLAILAVLVTMALALIRAFLGPSAYNRMLAANMFQLTDIELQRAFRRHALERQIAPVFRRHSTSAEIQFPV